MSEHDDSHELHIPMRAVDPVEIRGLTLSGLVQILGDQHVVVGHPEPINGCPWCVDDERATLVEMVVRNLNPDVWVHLSSRTARWVCAVQDIIAEESR